MNSFLSKLQKEFQTLYGFTHLCVLCGSLKEVSYCRVIDDGLAKSWNLTKEERRYLDFREGCCCKRCGASIRRQHLGMAFLETFNLKFDTDVQFLFDLPDRAKNENFTIAEINNCGNVHDYLKKLHGLSYSEYGPSDTNIPSENLMGLSYGESTFDFVLTSDVLEHVPDYTLALHEIKRILKNDGTFVFTVPWLPQKKTVIRSRLKTEGGIEYLLPPTFHGDQSLKMKDHLVFFEFGYDFVLELKKLFNTKIYASNGYGNYISSVFVCNK